MLTVAVLPDVVCLYLQLQVRIAVRVCLHARYPVQCQDLLLPTSGVSQDTEIPPL